MADNDIPLTTTLTTHSSGKHVPNCINMIPNGPLVKTLPDKQPFTIQGFSERFGSNNGSGGGGGAVGSGCGPSAENHSEISC